MHIVMRAKGILGFWTLLVAMVYASMPIKDEEKGKGQRRNQAAPRIQPGSERSVRIGDDPEEMPISLEKAVERATKIQSKSYPKPEQPNFTGLRSKRIGPKSNTTGHSMTQSSTFYPGGEKMLTDRDAQKDRLSDPTDGMTDTDKQQTWREIQVMQQRIEEMKQKAGFVSPQNAAPKSFTSTSAPKTSASTVPKGFASSAGIGGGQTNRSANQIGRSALKSSLLGGDLTSRPGLTVHHETLVDENQNKVILTTVTHETPRGMKTSRYYSPVGTSSLKGSLVGIPSAVATSMVSAPMQPQTRRTDNRQTCSLIKPRYTTDMGYPLLTTTEMPFPHVFQAKIAPWSGSLRSELTNANGAPLKIDVSSDASSASQSGSSAGATDIKSPAEDTGGRISSRLVPDTFRRVAEITGLRREQSDKGGKGFLERDKNSATVTKDEELKDVVVDKADQGDKKKKKKGKGEAGQEKGVEDDPAQDNIAGDLDKVDGKDKVDGLPNKTRKHGEHSKHTHHHRNHHKKDNGGKQKEEDKILPTGLRKTTTNDSDDEKTAPLHHVDSERNNQQHAVIIDEHDESDSYDDDHVCKKLQPLLRYVEYEYVINTSTGFANVFGLIMSMLQKLGAF